jgi:hypothetical protein
MFGFHCFILHLLLLRTCSRHFHTIPSYNSQRPCPDAISRAVSAAADALDLINCLARNHSFFSYSVYLHRLFLIRSVLTISEVSCYRSSSMARSQTANVVRTSA